MTFHLFKSLALALAVAFCTSAVTFLVKLFKVRKRMLDLRGQGLPMPPYNPIFGHLLFCNRILSKLPKDAHKQYVPDQIRRELPQLGPVYYLDTWPFGPVMMIVAAPSTLYQMIQAHSLPKYRALKSFLRPLTDGLDLVTMEGQNWRHWRSTYNPGFSNNHLMSLVPEIVMETATFCQILQEHADAQDMFAMKRHTDNLAMDVIGRVVLDTKLNSQREYNNMVEALRRQVRSLNFGANVNPFTNYNPIRTVMQWYNAYQMNSYLSQYLDRRFNMHQFQDDRPSKTVIDLALQTYIAEKPKDTRSEGMDATFKKFAISQAKIFLFSGHDTTSSTVCYIFYLLSTHESVLTRLRKEHDSVFGSDQHQKISKLKKEPFLLNQLPFTLAVIKETLRLFPVVSSTRGGEPAFNITDASGRSFPTDDFLVWSMSLALHRDPHYWPQPDQFLPERWLTTTEDPLSPRKGAWRAFEYGPRACLGQELAIIEMKVVMVMVLQKFDIEAGYAELDRQAPRPSPNMVNGERAYQVQLAQPSGDFPCRVRQIMR